jgi:hypothetical protein
MHSLTVTVGVCWAVPSRNRWWVVLETLFLFTTTCCHVCMSLYYFYEAIHSEQREDLVSEKENEE